MSLLWQEEHARIYRVQFRVVFYASSPRCGRRRHIVTTDVTAQTIPQSPEPTLFPAHASGIACACVASEIPSLIWDFVQPFP